MMKIIHNELLQPEMEQFFDPFLSEELPEIEWSYIEYSLEEAEKTISELKLQFNLNEIQKLSQQLAN